MHWSRCPELRAICWLSSPQTVIFLQLPSSPLFLILLSPLSRFSLSLHCTEPELLVTVALTVTYERIFRVVKWWKFKPVDTSHVPVQNIASLAASPAIYILDVSTCAVISLVYKNQARRWFMTALYLRSSVLVCWIVRRKTQWLLLLPAFISFKEV